MYAHQKQVTPKFQPVSLVLETQEQVDALFAVFNYAPLSDLLELKMGLPNNAWEALLPFTSDKRHNHFFTMNKYVKVSKV